MTQKTSHGLDYFCVFCGICFYASCNFCVIDSAKIMNVTPIVIVKTDESSVGRQGSNNTTPIKKRGLIERFK